MDELSGFELYLKRQNLYPKTIKQHKNNIKLMMKLCDPWTPDNFNKFILKSLDTVKAASINKYVQTAKKYCEFKKVTFPEECFKKLKETPEYKAPFSDEEIDAFIDLPPDPNKEDRGSHAKFSMYWRCLALTAARPSEIRKLTVDDVDLSNNCFIFRLTKTGTGRPVKIHPLLLTHVKDYLKTVKGKCLFPAYGKLDEPFTENAYLKNFAERRERLGIKKYCVPTTFRHSLLSNMLNNDGMLLDVQQIAGHSSPKTTAHYRRGNLKGQLNALNKASYFSDKMGGRALISKFIDDLLSAKLEEREDIEYQEILIALQHLHKSVKINVKKL